MDLVLTLVSVVSFFALILAWTVLPATTEPAAGSTQSAAAPSAQPIN